MPNTKSEPHIQIELKYYRFLILLFEPKQNNKIETKEIHKEPKNYYIS